MGNKKKGHLKLSSIIGTLYCDTDVGKVLVIKRENKTEIITQFKNEECLFLLNNLIFDEMLEQCNRVNKINHFTYFVTIKNKVLLRGKSKLKMKMKIRNRRYLRYKNKIKQMSKSSEKISFISKNKKSNILEQPEEFSTVIFLNSNHYNNSYTGNLIFPFSPKCSNSSDNIKNDYECFFDKTSFNKE